MPSSKQWLPIVLVIITTINVYFGMHDANATQLQIDSALTAFQVPSLFSGANDGESTTGTGIYGLLGGSSLAAASLFLVDNQGDCPINARSGKCHSWGNDVTTTTGDDIMPSSDMINDANNVVQLSRIQTISSPFWFMDLSIQQIASLGERLIHVLDFFVFKQTGDNTKKKFQVMLDTHKTDGLHRHFASAMTRQYQLLIHSYQHLSTLGKQPKAKIQLSLKDSHQKLQKPSGGGKICFTTVVYGKDSAGVDEVPDSTTSHAELHNKDRFNHYAVTNLADLSCKGWDRILLATNFSDYGYVRQSRYAKFLGWELFGNECATIFYADGGWVPSQKSTFWEAHSRALVESSPGVLHFKHMLSKGRLLGELNLIVRKQKDSKANVDMERKWLTSQPDFVNKVPMYCNMAFGYSTSNQRYKAMSSEFWSNYYTDQRTFRDQPFWNFLLHRHNMTPLVFGKWPDSFNMRGKWEQRSAKSYKYAWVKNGKSGFGGHKYVEKK